ncbi:hypothetical protein [Kitasatospora camelliae]|uniref:Uncharacterized protein n=1 Tax=Kitasatospora camelliae TaxID=3156397 RepID=A0AAU8K1X1_9ACTN
MLVETMTFALIGLAVGAAAAALLPGYFPTSRSLTVATAVVAAMIGGLICDFSLDGRQPAVALAVSAVGSVLLVSVLARPERAAPRARRRRPA